MIQAGVIEEFVNDAVDSALDSEDIEEETEEEVEKVLAEIAGETAAQLPEAVRKERIKVPAQKASTSQEVCKPVLLSSIHVFSGNEGTNSSFFIFTGRSYSGGCR